MPTFQQLKFVGFWIMLKEHKSVRKKENCSLGTIDTWLVWKLTDGAAHVTDYSNAARTMLLQYQGTEMGRWNLRILNIPKAMLPEVRSNSEIYGKTAPFHFYGGQVPIAGMAGDQQAAPLWPIGFWTWYGQKYLWNWIFHHHEYRWGDAVIRE